MIPRGREIARGIAIFALVVVALALPWRGIGSGFNRALSALCNVALSGAAFAGGIRAELAPLEPGETAQAGSNVMEDTRLVLRAPAGRHASLGLSLRRDAYLPLAIFLGAVAALPLAVREKVACLALGAPVVILIAVASIWLLVAQVTSHLPGAASGQFERAVSAFMFERWLTPPGNRVIAPVLFAAALAALVHRYFQRARRARSRPPAPALARRRATRAERRPGSRRNVASGPLVVGVSASVSRDAPSPPASRARCVQSTSRCIPPGP